MMPGETINISLEGSVRLETLRERDVMRLNAHLGVFLTPVRWVQTNFPTYMLEGPDTAETINTTSGEDNWSKYGIGSYNASANGNFLTMYKNNYDRVFNEWYKWPEDADLTGTMGDHGRAAVPMSKAWSRVRNTATPDDSADYTVSSATNFDVRTLAETQAKFKSAMKRDIFAMDDRWMEYLNNTYVNANPSREVDQVPIMIDQVDLGVNPREMPATDGASLGQWQSMFDFAVNHQIRGVVAPEHCILLYMLTIRFAPIVEGCSPLATDQLDWHELTADPEFLSAAMPRAVQRRELQQTTSTTELGYLPAGWQWRSDFDVIGKAVDIRDSFPYTLLPTTQAQCRDATRVKDAFRSQALDDYLVDIFCKEDSRQPIGTAMDSFQSGMGMKGIRNTNSEFVRGGKNL